MRGQSLMAKIRKCLRLAHSSNEYEAAAALAKARALMLEHGISDADVELSEIEQSTARASRTKSPPLWESVLCLTIERALGVSSFIDQRGDRAFIGRGPEAEIAAYAFAFLFRLLKAARSEYIRKQLHRCKAGRKRQRADVFCEGWALSLHHKVVDLLPMRSSDPLIDKFLAEHHPDLVPVGSRRARKNSHSTDNDYFRGCAAGEAVNIYQGVKNAAPALLE